MKTAALIMISGVLALKCAPPALAKSPVTLELVLAIDASTSVDENEFELQRDGLAAAFRHPDVLRAIETLGPDGMAVTIVQWAGAAQHSNGIGWHRVSDAGSATAFSKIVSRMRRAQTGFTNIFAAIDYALRLIEENDFHGERKTIDVSGDGVSDQQDPAIARDRAVANGVTINGLVIHSVEYDLGDLARIALIAHYKNQVIGGEGAFLMEAENFDHFAEAIRRKLVREISGAQFVFRPDAIPVPIPALTGLPAAFAER